jgi:PKD repeat protein
MWTTSKLFKPVLAAVSTLALVATLLVVGRTETAAAAPAPVVQPPGSSVTADRVPTVQIDGVVWSQAVVGNTVYAGGKFSNARPAGAAPGTSLTPRGNLLAYDITTGNLVTSFAPNLNGQVLSVAASPDGSRIYVVGDFTTANGQARRRVAAYDTATGALIASFNPSGPNSQARAVIATNDTVYVGGGFAGLANGTLRNNLVAYRASDAAVLPWNPNADYTVWTLAISGDGASVFAGGSFQNVGGLSAYGLAKINTAGALDTSWDPSVKVGGPNAGISSLRVQGNFVYGTSWNFHGVGNLEGTFKIPVGNSDVEWVTDCHGDNYSSFMADGIVYVAGHSHYCGNMGGGFPQYSQWRFQHAIAWTDTAGGDILNNVYAGYHNWHGQALGPALVNWLPDMAIGSFTGQYQAGWSVGGNDRYVVYGGEFPTVNGVGQQGLVRFAARSLAPNKERPQFATGSIVPTLVPVSPTAVRVSWPAGFDRDDYTLTYQVIRDGAFGAPVYTTAANSEWWNLPLMGFVDAGLQAGSHHSYQIVVSDPNNNRVFGTSASVTLPAGVPTPSAYATAVRADGARIYWPMDETSGTTVTDRAASNSSGPNVGLTDGRADTGVTWNQPGAIPGNSAASLGNNNFSRVFAGNCPQTAGCNWGTETAPDTFTSQLWFKTTTTGGGRLLGFGDQQNNEASGSGHHDRHVYLDNSGHVIFGVRAQDNSARTISSPATYRDNQWHMVTATMSSAGTKLYVDGTLVNQRADTTQGESYLGYWRLGGDVLSDWPAAPSSQNFVGAVDEIAIYPTALSARQILTEYQARNGGVGNQAPTASFTSSTSGLTASVNGSSSSDSDGTITSYSWNFGDGATSTGVTASHAYASGGTYTVILTVTDNAGAGGSISHSVTVAAAGVLASDAFNRNVASGWGSADVGGSWTASGAGSSVSGGAGNLQMAARSGPSAYLNAVSATNVDLVTALRYDKAATGTIYSSMVARRIGTSDYRVKVRSTSTQTSLDLVRTVSGTETMLASQVVPGLVMAAGDELNVRLQIVGTGTTTLNAKIWKTPASEPATWTLTATDTTAALQSPGAVGFYSYLSGSATNSPITLQVQNFLVQQP